MGVATWIANTIAKGSATAADATLLRVVDDPSGSPSSLKLALSALATYVLKGISTNPAIFPISTTGRASLRITDAGTAPTSPVNGDMWIESNALKIRLNGATKTVTVS